MEPTDFTQVNALLNALERLTRKIASLPQSALSEILPEINELSVLVHDWVRKSLDADTKAPEQNTSSGQQQGALFKQLLSSMHQQHGDFERAYYQAKAEAQQNTSEFRAIFNAIYDAVTVYNASGQAVRTNPAALRVLGIDLTKIDRTEAMRRIQITHPDGRPVQVEELASSQALAGMDVQDLPFRFTDGLGRQRSIHASGGPLRDESGSITGAVIIWHDVTELEEARQQAEESSIELARANQEYKRANIALERAKSELQIAVGELRDFAFFASHDLQEPLRKVRAYAELLKSHSATDYDSNGQDYIRRIVLATRRMQEMIDGLLAYSRISTRANPFGPVDLSKVAHEVLEDLEIRLEQTKGQVEFGDLGTVEGDSLQIRELLQNLISNALKFHRPGVAPQVRVWVNTAAGEETTELIVEDNGIGFEETKAKNIFQPFVRLNARGQYEGAGMGLAICHKIVERHGGQISAHGNPGEGASFIIRLPRPKQEKPDPAHQDAAHLDESPRKKARNGQ